MYGHLAGDTEPEVLQVLSVSTESTRTVSLNVLLQPTVPGAAAPLDHKKSRGPIQRLKERVLHWPRGQHSKMHGDSRAGLGRGSLGDFPRSDEPVLRALETLRPYAVGVPLAGPAGVQWRNAGAAGASTPGATGDGAAATRGVGEVSVRARTPGASTAALLGNTSQSDTEGSAGLLGKPIQMYGAFNPENPAVTPANRELPISVTHYETTPITTAKGGLPISATLYETTSVTTANRGPPMSTSHHETTSVTTGNRGLPISTSHHETTSVTTGNRGLPISTSHHETTSVTTGNRGLPISTSHHETTSATTENRGLQISPPYHEAPTVSTTTRGLPISSSQYETTASPRADELDSTDKRPRIPKPSFSGMELGIFSSMTFPSKDKVVKDSHGSVNAGSEFQWEHGDSSHTKINTDRLKAPSFKSDEPLPTLGQQKGKAGGARNQTASGAEKEMHTRPEFSKSKLKLKEQLLGESNLTGHARVDGNSNTSHEKQNRLSSEKKLESTDEEIYPLVTEPSTDETKGNSFKDDSKIKITDVTDEIEEKHSVYPSNEEVCDSVAHKMSMCERMEKRLTGAEGKSLLPQVKSSLCISKPSETSSKSNNNSHTDRNPERKTSDTDTNEKRLLTHGSTQITPAGSKLNSKESFVKFNKQDGKEDHSSSSNFNSGEATSPQRDDLSHKTHPSGSSQVTEKAERQGLETNTEGKLLTTKDDESANKPVGKKPPTHDHTAHVVSDPAPKGERKNAQTGITPAKQEACIALSSSSNQEKSIVKPHSTTEVMEMRKDTEEPPPEQSRTIGPENKMTAEISAKESPGEKSSKNAGNELQKRMVSNKRSGKTDQEEQKGLSPSRSKTEKDRSEERKRVSSQERIASGGVRKRDASSSDKAPDKSSEIKKSGLPVASSNEKRLEKPSGKGKKTSPSVQEKGRGQSRDSSCEKSTLSERRKEGLTGRPEEASKRSSNRLASSTGADPAKTRARGKSIAEAPSAGSSKDRCSCCSPKPERPARRKTAIAGLLAPRPSTAPPATSRNSRPNTFPSFGSQRDVALHHREQSNKLSGSKGGCGSTGCKDQAGQVLTQTQIPGWDVLALESEIRNLRGQLGERRAEELRLRREIHKLRSVLQQATSFSEPSNASEQAEQVEQAEDLPELALLASLQTRHTMAGGRSGAGAAGSAVPGAGAGGASNKKQGVSGESCDPGASPVAQTTFPKDSRSQHLITAAILDNDFLKNLARSQIRELVECMYPETITKGSYVVREGDAGSHLYVLAEGEMEVLKEGTVLGRMGPGKVFGELAILYNCTRTASIRAVTDLKVWVLDRKVFQQIMMRTGIRRLEENLSFLRSVPLLKNLSEATLAKIADVLELEFYPAGSYIVRQGASGQTFFIISGGSVQVTQRVPGTTEEVEIRTLERGDYFGEQALLRDDSRTASVRALHPGVECLTLDRESFLTLIGSLSELQQKDYGDDSRQPSRTSSAYSMHSEAVSDVEVELLRLEDLQVVGTLGVGGFGSVRLVVAGARSFALKCLDKSHIVATGQQEHVISERDLLLAIHCPFIVRLHRTFRDDRFVYLLLEACLGGELWSVLQRRGCLDDEQARFAVGCVIQALEYLHSRSIIYRDVKPENLVLDARGYVKLVDFGFSKRLLGSNKTWTFCGTPDYVAPEVILNRGHDRAVDCWALGILIFELLTGTPPFTAADPMHTYNLILKGMDCVLMPRSVGRPPANLIRRLCKDVPSERLGLQGVRQHKWFQGFDWENLGQQTMPSPIETKVSGPTDMSNFDAVGKHEDHPLTELSNWEADF